MRSFWTAAVLALMLVAGVVGYALADVPDATPSAPDPAHTFYGCFANFPSNQAWRTFYALDKSVGNGQCPSSHTEVRLVPAVPAP